MLYTVKDIFAIIMTAMLCIGGGLLFWGFVNLLLDYEHKLLTKALTIVLVVSSFATFCTFLGWYNTRTADGMRKMKRYESTIKGGLEREVVIKAEDGREVYRYEGKIDIENDHDARSIRFVENGKEHVIYYGVQDSITVTER